VVVVLLGVLADRSFRRGEDIAVAAIVLGVAALIAIAAGVISWLVTRYRVEGDHLRIESGWVVRRSRRVPLARLQAIDVVRPLLARAFGLAELKLEVVGHSKAEAPLAYLREDEAQRLRARLIALAAGWHEETPTAPEQVLVVVPAGPLIASTLLMTPAFVMVGFVVMLVVIAFISWQVAIGVGAAVFGIALTTVSLAWRRVSMEWDFRLAVAPDGLRLRHGLLETRVQTIPPGRIQALRFVEPIAWRPFGWVRVEVDVAGYHAKGGRGNAIERRATSALLPIAPRSLAVAIVSRVTDGVDLAQLVLPRPPRRARFRSPLAWHNLGVAWSGAHAVTRTGILTRRTDVVPQTKLQSMRLEQGPWQRRLRLASVAFDTAGRNVHAVARHRDADEAERLVYDAATRARAARAADIRTGRIS
jgi:putative membrane protein